MGETVRVRIAVVVDDAGLWCGDGDSECSDEDAVTWAEDNHQGEPFRTRHVVFVEADVPKPAKPEPLTVEGEVAPEEAEAPVRRNDA